MILGWALRLLVVVVGSLCLPVVVFASFSDVPVGSEYALGINFLQQKGIVSGYADGTFKSNANINRAELAKILVESTGVEIQNLNDCFEDVKGSDWYVKYVCTAKSLGWVQGYSDGTFKPANKINRAEALKIISKAERWDFSMDAAASYDDVPLNEWYSGFTAYAKNLNFLPFTTKFSPASFISRGEFSEIYYRVLYTAELGLEGFIDQIGRVVANKDYASNTFENVVLDSGFPSAYFDNEVYVFSGRVVGPYEKVFVAIIDLKTNKTIETFSGDVKEGNRFSVPAYFDANGDFGIGIVPGTSGSTKIAKVAVTSFGAGMGRFEGEATPDKPSDLEVAFAADFTMVTFESVADFAAVRFEQNDSSVTYFSRQIGRSIPVRFSDFTDFREGEVEVSARVIGSNDDFTLFSEWSSFRTTSIRAVKHHFSQITDEVGSVSVPDFFQVNRRVNISAQAQTIVDNDLYVVGPDGFVDKVTQNDSNVGSGQYFDYSFVPTVAGTYIVEVNNVNGLAVINHPIYQGGRIPLLPDYFDLSSNELSPIGSINEAHEVEVSLNLINDARLDHGLPLVSFDNNLSKMAAAHATDLLTHRSFSHFGTDGRGPNERRMDFGLKTLVGENIAKVSGTRYGHEALMRSPVHRANILNKDWTKVGISVKKALDGHYYIVQEFSFDEQDLSELFEKIIVGMNQDLRQSVTLSKGAQKWSDLMVDKKFFNTEHDGDTLYGVLDTAGMSRARSLILKVSDLSSAKESLIKNTDLDDSDWTTFGFGLSVGDDGLIYITLIWGN